ncbi:MAG: mannitol-1-phosphate 5-dehydrogenase [Patescibacteria group bacterium]
MEKKAVVFGAGNIGRGFLGERLYESGFTVTFIDTDEKKINLINQRREYPVIVVSNDGIREKVVRDVSAIVFSDNDTMVRALVEAEVILTAVGKNALTPVATILAKGLMERIKRRPNSDIHIVVVACENVNDNTEYLRTLLSKCLSEEDMEKVNNSISFPKCVVDRIVPNTLPSGANQDALSVAVEEYFQLVVDETALKAPMPKIDGVEFSSDLSAILEQKLFTLNMAHAIVGYYGYLRKYSFIHEAIADENVFQLLAGALKEVESTITMRHSSINRKCQQLYAEKVISRFQNPYLKDEIVRVARQSKRKLGREDRLIKPALMTLEQGQTPVYLSTGITAALFYDYKGDSQACEIMLDIRAKGIEQTLKEVSGLTTGREMEIARMVKSNHLFRSL